MADAVRKLLLRSFDAYRRGRYLGLFGQSYGEYVVARDNGQLADELLEQGQYRLPLQDAFAKYPPRGDEVYLYAIRNSCVVTSQRLFLLGTDGLLRPPIPLDDIAGYEQSTEISERTGAERITEILTLSDGETIERSVLSAVDPDTIQQLIKAASDPAMQAQLHGEPPSPKAAGAAAARQYAGASGRQVGDDGTLYGLSKGLVGFLAGVVFLAANGAPLLEGGPAVVQWLAVDGNVIVLAGAVILGVLAPMFMPKG